MIRYSWIVIALVNFACNQDKVQIVESESFIKFFDNGTGIDLLETEDGGFLCMGFDEENQETRIIKTDAHGNAQWGNQFDRGFVGVSIDIMPQGGFIVIGAIFGKMVMAVLDDQQGAPFRISYNKPNYFSTGIGLIANEDQDVYGAAITFDADGSVVALGTYEDDSDSVGIFLLKYDLVSNEVIWHFTTEPEFPGAQAGSISSNVYFTGNGDFLWTAGSFFPSAYTKSYLANPNSMTIKESLLNGSPDENYLLPEIVRTGINEFAVVGRYDQGGVRNLFMTQIDDLGNFLTNSEKIYTGISERPHLTATSDGGIVILTVDESKTHDDFLLIKTDGSGNPIWMRNIGGSGDESGGSIIETSEGNLVFFGTSVQEGIERMTLVQTDRDGGIR